MLSGKSRWCKRFAGTVRRTGARHRPDAAPPPCRLRVGRRLVGGGRFSGRFRGRLLSSRLLGGLGVGLLGLGRLLGRLGRGFLAGFGRRFDQFDGRGRLAVQTLTAGDNGLANLAGTLGFKGDVKDASGRFDLSAPRLAA